MHGHIPGLTIYVQKLSTCKRCGCTHVAWLQNKSGKWYLAQWSGLGARDAGFAINKSAFHKCGECVEHGCPSGKPVQEQAV